MVTHQGNADIHGVMLAELSDVGVRLRERIHFPEWPLSKRVEIRSLDNRSDHLDCCCSSKVDVNICHSMDVHIGDESNIKQLTSTRCREHER